MKMMLLLFIFSCSGIMTALLLTIITWIVHVSLTREGRKDYGYATFSKFKEQFDKYEWFPHDAGDSFGAISSTEDTKFRYGIIEFEGKRMVMNNPVCWIRANVYARKYIKNNFKELKPNKNTVKW